jgi:hypothetical protein
MAMEPKSLEDVGVIEKIRLTMKMIVIAVNQ